MGSQEPEEGLSQTLKDVLEEVRKGTPARRTARTRIMVLKATEKEPGNEMHLVREYAGCRVEGEFGQALDQT